MSDEVKKPLILIDPESFDFLHLDSGPFAGLLQKKSLVDFGTRREFNWPAHCLPTSPEWLKLAESYDFIPELDMGKISALFPESDKLSRVFTITDGQVCGVPVIKLSEIEIKHMLHPDVKFLFDNPQFNPELPEGDE